MEHKEITNKGLMREYEIILKSQEINNNMDEELDRLAATIKVSGFRPGKVPLSLVKQRHSKTVFNSTIEKLIDRHGKTIIEHNKLRPAMTPRVKLLSKIEEGKDIKALVSIEIIPSIKLIDINKLSFARYSADITDKDVDLVLGRLADSQKQYISVSSNRSAKLGDGVSVDYDKRNYFLHLLSIR